MSTWSNPSKSVSEVTWANTLLTWAEAIMTWSGLSFWSNPTKH